MRELTEYILTRIEPTLHDFELDGYDKTIEHFKKQLEIIINDYDELKLPQEFSPTPINLDLVKLRIAFDSIIRSHIMMPDVNNVLWAWVKEHAMQINDAVHEKEQLDSKRLDWLEELFKKDDYMNFSKMGNTLREAIDNAMHTKLATEEE